jgi:hypothetical protein
MAIEIKHLVGAQESIDDNTQIVRYMKLSTLVLLLADRVFLPSLRCLQSDDKLEGLVPHMMSLDYGKALYPRIKDFEPWLLEQKKGPKRIPAEGRHHDRITLGFLARVWLEQLSIRRCLWCWNKQTGHSHALWKIYGQRGVALVSTVGEVKKALAKAGRLRTIVSPSGEVKTALEEASQLRAIVSPVSYSIPPRFSFEEIMRWEFEMNQEGNLAFPYLFKEDGYTYEEEVRFVFGVHPHLLADAPGIVAEIDGKSLVESYVSKLWVSPDIPKEEGNMIRYLVADICAGSCRNFPYPAEKDDERLMRFLGVGGNPFTTADAPPGLFSDLD